MADDYKPLGWGDPLGERARRPKYNGPPKPHPPAEYLVGWADGGEEYLCSDCREQASDLRSRLGKPWRCSLTLLDDIKHPCAHVDHYKEAYLKARGY